MILLSDPTPLGSAVRPQPRALAPEVPAVFPVLVHGPSMSPTLRHGDAVLVRRGGRPVRPGDVVVARFRVRPDLLVVKRAVRPAAGGWWVRGDNPFAGDDSRTYGVADVVGRVVLRWWPRPALLTGRRANSTPDEAGGGTPD